MSIGYIKNGAYHKVAGPSGGIGLSITKQLSINNQKSGPNNAFSFDFGDVPSGRYLVELNVIGGQNTIGTGFDNSPNKSGTYLYSGDGTAVGPANEYRPSGWGVTPYETVFVNWKGGQFKVAYTRLGWEENPNSIFAQVVCKITKVAEV